MAIGNMIQNMTHRLYIFSSASSIGIRLTLSKMINSWNKWMNPISVKLSTVLKCGVLSGRLPPE